MSLLRTSGKGCLGLSDTADADAVAVLKRRAVQAAADEWPGLGAIAACKD